MTNHLSADKENALSDPSIFVHQRAIVEPGAQIGKRTRVWAFTHVLPAR